MKIKKGLQTEVEIEDIASGVEAWRNWMEWPFL